MTGFIKDNDKDHDCQQGLNQSEADFMVRLFPDERKNRNCHDENDADQEQIIYVDIVAR